MSRVADLVDRQMTWKVISIAAAALCLIVSVVACAGNPPPVPVFASRADWEILGGHWSGAYKASPSGRHGLIDFTLSASEEQASGDVLMIRTIPACRIGRILLAIHGLGPSTHLIRSSSLSGSFALTAARSAARLRGTGIPIASVRRRRRFWERRRRASSRAPSRRPARTASESFEALGG